MKYRETKSLYPANKVERFLSAVAEYLDAGGEEPIDPVAVADWAMAKGRLEAPKVEPKRLLAREIARALRQELHKDPKGRIVRTNHAIRQQEVTTQGETIQHYLWSNMGRATQEHMENSLGGRRRSILGSCKQLKSDTDSFNEFHGDPKRPIPFSGNFDHDLEEMDLPTEYNNEEPEADDGIDS